VHCTTRGRSTVRLQARTPPASPITPPPHSLLPMPSWKGGGHAKKKNQFRGAGGFHKSRQVTVWYNRCPVPHLLWDMRIGQRGFGTKPRDAAALLAVGGVNRLFATHEDPPNRCVGAPSGGGVGFGTAHGCNGPHQRWGTARAEAFHAPRDLGLRIPHPWGVSHMGTGGWLPGFEPATF
jgi:hypothetical protein